MLSVTDDAFDDEQLDDTRRAQLRALFDSYCAPGQQELGLSEWRQMVSERQLPQAQDTSAAFLRVVPPESTSRPAIGWTAFLELLAEIAKGAQPGVPQGQAIRLLVDDYLHAKAAAAPRQLPDAPPPTDLVDQQDIIKFCTLHGFPGVRRPPVHCGLDIFVAADCDY